jgi:hypothetical protein
MRRARSDRLRTDSKSARTRRRILTAGASAFRRLLREPLTPRHVHEQHRQIEAAEHAVARFGEARVHVDRRLGAVGRVAEVVECRRG